MKKLVIYDHGLNTELAVTLAAEGNIVGYFTPESAAFPKSANSVIGTGLEGVTRIDNWEQAVERADVIVCPDTFCGSLVDDLQRRGRHVWGAGTRGERLEQDRHYMDGLQRSLGLPTPKRELIRGVTKLIERLKTEKDVWVKLSRFRGDKETFYHEDYSSSQAQFLGQMFVDFGANDDLEFIIEKPIKNVVEVGDDRLVVDGTFLSPRVIGYEAKDAAYLGFVTEQACPVLDAVNKALAPTLSRARTFFSTELRGDMLIDPTVRCPHPPLSVMLALFQNIGQAVVEGAQGNVIELLPKAQYGAGVIIYSDWADHHWCELSFPPAMRRYIKLQRAYRDASGKYWALPGQSIVATCVGIGDTPALAISHAKKVADSIKCAGAEHDASALDKLLEETVPAGKKAGIPF
jgi:hypothetical protein